MSQQVIPLDHPRNPAMLRESERRHLTLEPLGDGRYAVSSHSRKGAWHAVEVSRKGYCCSCDATENCTHGAYASAYHFEDVAVAWRNQLDDEFRDLRLAILRGELSARKLASLVRKGRRAAQLDEGKPVSPVPVEAEATPF